jgi:HK97 gp10 family phage protein
MAAIKVSVRLKVNGDPIKGSEIGAREGAIVGATILANLAKEFAPGVKSGKSTGRLRNSIMWKSGTDDGAFINSPGGAEKLTEPAGGKEAIVGTSVKYGTYQEFGTRKMAAQPFMRPAAAIMKGSSTSKAIAEANRISMKGALKGAPEVFNL